MSNKRATLADFNNAPLAMLAVAFASGILLARFAPAHVIASFVFGVTFTIAAWRLVRRENRTGARRDPDATLDIETRRAFANERRASHLRAACLLAAAVCAGATFAGIERTDIDVSRIRRLLGEGHVARSTPVEITGVIEGAAEPLPDGFALDLRAERLRAGDDERIASGRIRLFAPVSGGAALAAYERLELRAGARVRVMVVLRRDEAFRNPGVDSRIDILDRQGYDATATIKSARLVERLDDEPVLLPAWWLARRRAHLIAQAHDLFEPHTAGLLGAMLLGDAGFVTREAGEAFRAGGTYHVLVISGMHVTIVGLLAAFAVNNFTERRAPRFVVPVLAVWAFVIAVGAEISVVRAGLMFTFILAAGAIGRAASSANALGAAGFVLLAWQPAALFQPSFQLTFLSVFAIVCVAVPLLARLKQAGEWRPTTRTPYPPRASRWWRTLGEALYWDARAWRAEMRRGGLTYELPRKSPLAIRLNRWRVQPVLRYVFAIVLVSACVQIVMLPFAVVLFHRVSLVALLLNVLVGFELALVAVLALVALASASVNPALAAPFVSATEAINRFTIRINDPARMFDLLSFRLPSYTDAPAAIYLIYYLPLAALLVYLARWRVLPAAPGDVVLTRRSRLIASTFLLATLTVLIVAHPFSARTSPGRLRIDFLDVGQGDAALVTMPDGTTLLVDGGGRRATNDDAAVRSERSDGDRSEVEYDRRSIGDAVVSEYLWWRGLDRIDYLLATHADTDHIDGLNAVARNFRVRAAFVGRDAKGDPDYDRFDRTLRARGVPLQKLAGGDVLRFADNQVRVEVINPIAEDSEHRRGSNDDSVVLLVIYGDRRFILTGDIEEKAEARLVSTHGERLRADVVKVAHHGSRTSSTKEFVRLTSPQFAVIPVGTESPYDHPHTQVVERWRAGGARVLTTGASGTITVSTDGDDLRIETYIPEDAPSHEP